MNTNSELPRTFPNIGQNSMDELLNKGRPSTLKFIFMAKFVFNPEKIAHKPFANPLYQYWPLALLSIFINCGVFNKVRLSLGKNLNPKLV